ncbi:MAG: domain containing protein [Verrucomicrobiales bacterium]|nr:domain containing protein [Verrucomicrobiales bacterium]
MRKGDRIWLGFLALAVLGMFVWQRLATSEAVYQGKTAHSWVIELLHWDGQSDSPIVQAFAEMGTNALPAIRKVMLQETKSEKILRWINTKQSKIVFRLPFHRDDPNYADRSELTSKLFRTLGLVGLPTIVLLLNEPDTANLAVNFMRPLGCDALPSLTQACSNASLQVRLMAIWGLGVIGPRCTNSEAVISALITRLSDEDWRGRYNSIAALRKLLQSPELVVPSLKNGLKSDRAEIRALTARTLGDFGPAARVAIPWLVESSRDTDAEVSLSISNALKAIESTVVQRAGTE